MNKITIEEFVKRVNALQAGEHISVQLVEDGYVVTAFATLVKGNRYHFMMVEGFYGNCEQGFEGLDEQGVYEYIDYVKALADDTNDLDEIAELIVVEDLSAMKEPRKVLGYQIHDDNGEFPDGLFSFMVFKTRSDAESYMLVEDLTGFDIHEYYEGDIEAPTFIGMRIFREGERVFNCEPSLADSDLRDWAVICKDTVAMYADQLVLLKMEDGSENETDSHSIYQIAEGKVCPRCGGPLCVEHDEDVDYPYYCPECDENFYDCEVQ